MTKESPFIVITFNTTSEALAMEKIGRQSLLKGRLSPIPRELSAGCGFAWCEPAANEEALRDLICRYDIQYEAIQPLMM